jgi:NAD(P)H dehydrogenase (quinone)
MRVLIVYAHNNPKSFTHAVLEQVERGLADAGHTYEVIDLYAIGFNPVFTMHDASQFIHHTVPEEKLDRAMLEQAIIDSAGNPLRRWLAGRWVRGKSIAEMVRLFEENRPADVRAHQAKVARAEGLIFIAPVFWMGFPAILKGWLERVFAYGFAYTLAPRGWDGNLDGRTPLLTHRKGLIITPTFFTEAEYDTGWRQAMDTVLCDWCLKMAGVQQAEHAYFYAVAATDDQTRKAYLSQAYDLGKAFESNVLRSG